LSVIEESHSAGLGPQGLSIREKKKTDDSGTIIILGFTETVVKDQMLRNC